MTIKRMILKHFNVKVHAVVHKDKCNLLQAIYWLLQRKLNNYSTLCAVLEEVNQTGHDEYAMRAGGCFGTIRNV